MPDERPWTYYAAILASLLSTLGWLGAVGGVVYTIYLGATGEFVALFLWASIGAVVIGIVFARVERRLYDPSRSR